MKIFPPDYGFYLHALMAAFIAAYAAILAIKIWRLF
jgi:hypothetical protein